METLNITKEVGEEPIIFCDDKPLPDLSLNKQTINEIAAILLGGGADNHAFENGFSKNIREKLRSGNAGFLDRNIYPKEIQL